MPRNTRRRQAPLHAFRDVAFQTVFQGWRGFGNPCTRNLNQTSDGRRARRVDGASARVRARSAILGKSSHLTIFENESEPYLAVIRDFLERHGPPVAAVGPGTG
jgi:hypothetical protein